jgi:hypothetical protein
MGASILLPDSYYREKARHYPVVYVIPGFDGSDQIDESTELEWQRPLRSLGSEFIVVFLEPMMDIDGENIHSQFADSATNGPWGAALTSEFIPATDKHFRTISFSSARFLFGHSSGGWSVLWLQVNYSEIFNGAWAVAPDSVDFHDFMGPDLTKADQNFFHDAAGNEYGTCRWYGHDTSTLQRLVQGTGGCSRSQGETIVGRKAWAERQFDTYDDVFSPPTTNGYPAHLFDHATGIINRDVAAYWEEHYDITRLLQERRSLLSGPLRGKLHVFVGAQDTFHLEGAVMLMRDALAKLGGDAEFGIAPGANHWSIFDYHGGLIPYALSEMAKRLATQEPPHMETR